MMSRPSEEDSSSSSSSEDEGIVPLHKKLKFSQTLDRIRNRDSMIYSKDEIFFESDGSISNNDEERSLDQPLFAKDIHARQVRLNSAILKLFSKLLDQGADAFISEEEEEDGFEDRKRWNYDAEQNQLRNELLTQIENTEFKEESENDDFGGFKKREIQTPFDDPEHLQTSNEVARCLESYFASENELKPEDADFLRNYIEKEEWRIDQGLTEDDLEDTFEQDEEYLEKGAQFEANYNFRFEEPGSSEIVGYPRVLDQSIRQTKSARKRQRANKAAKKQQQRQQAEELTKQQKNAKRKEIEAKLKEVDEECRGALNPEIIEQLLDSDQEFDAVDWDSKMEQSFNDEFYKQSDEDLGMKQESNKAHLEDQKQELGRLFHEYYNLDHEDEIEGMKTRYRYMKVPKQDYGLAVEDILCLDDKELNEFVGLRRLNPYRDDLGSFKHHPGKLKKLLADVDYSSGGRRSNNDPQEFISREHETVEETHLLKKIQKESDPKIKARLESYSRMMLQPFREKKAFESEPKKRNRK